MLMHDLWREYIPPVFPSNEVPFERGGRVKDRWCPIEYPSSIFLGKGRGDFFQGGYFVGVCQRAREKKSMRDQSNDCYLYFSISIEIA